jgi:group I intron endonuclease
MLTTGESLSFSGIYCFIHRDTGMCYVGSSCRIGNRLRLHMRDVERGSNNAIHRAIRQHGVDAFDFEILERCPRELLLEREAFYIALLDCCSLRGYNTLATPTTPAYDAEVSPVTRMRISQASTGRKHTDEARARIAAAHRGKPGTMLGRKFTAEHKAKISKAHTGKKLSDETKAKIGLASRGRYFSPESRAKMRDSQLRRYAKTS